MKENDFAIVNPYSLYYVIKIRFALEKKNINSFCSKKEKTTITTWLPDGHQNNKLRNSSLKTLGLSPVIQLKNLQV